jgi:hypothetical protein
MILDWKTCGEKTSCKTQALTGRIILMWIFKRHWDGMAWTGFM